MAASPGTGEALDPAVARQLVTPFVSSWIGRARPGDVTDPDPVRRAAAWAHWLLGAMAPMTGSADRPYIGVVLPGRFYDPRGTGPKTPPHLEIPGHLFDRAAPEFPDRLAQVGAGLLFPWWLVPETLAAKRALFSVPRNAPTELTDLLNARHVSLRDALTAATSTAAAVWDRVEEQLIAAPADMASLAADDFTCADVAAYWPAGADLGLRVEFDRKLRDSQGDWVARRVGVWRVVGENDQGPFALGTITPRLTRSSLFTDPLFRVQTEAPAAALVRALVLRRVASRFGAGTSPAVSSHRAGARGPLGLRAVVARMGEKVPEASVASAVRFLRDYPDAQDAWTAIETWAAGRTAAGEPARAALTVSQDGFVAAHRAAARAVRRAEEPDRGDINVVLPLAWDASRVVRLTYAPRTTD